MGWLILIGAVAAIVFVTAAGKVSGYSAGFGSF